MFLRVNCELLHLCTLKYVHTSLFITEATHEKQPFNEG